MTDAHARLDQQNLAVLAYFCFGRPAGDREDWMRRALRKPDVSSEITYVKSLVDKAWTVEPDREPDGVDRASREVRGLLERTNPELADEALVALVSNYAYNRRK
jgi:hypothetical protein